MTLLVILALVFVGAVALANLQGPKKHKYRITYQVTDNSRRLNTPKLTKIKRACTQRGAEALIENRYPNKVVHIVHTEKVS